mmetsp:Transcript_98903/g.170300  ORF Transcript_98903/g.170300 Transcript_98903/m.170300 type:complete len:93 (-) Transcript_98903:181-459(-)
MDHTMVFSECCIVIERAPPTRLNENQVQPHFRSAAVLLSCVSASTSLRLVALASSLQNVLFRWVHGWLLLRQIVSLARCLGQMAGVAFGGTI